jgi:hypothetical protein
MRGEKLRKSSGDKEPKGLRDSLEEVLSSGIEISDRKSKSKTSFYITRLTQGLLKIFSDTYGISQGDMISWTPWMVQSLAQRSLERRKRSIATLRTLEQQIQSSIRAMESIAPHLSLLLHYPSEMISQLIDSEENAVEKKVISGLGIKKFDEGLFTILSEPFESEPAYQRDLEELMGGDVVDLLNILKNLPEKEAGNEHKDDEPRTDSD